MRDECRDALDHVWSFLDGEEPDTSADAIRDHLETCEPCLGEYEFQEALKTLVRRSCQESAPAALRARIVTEIARHTVLEVGCPEAGDTSAVVRRFSRTTSIRVVEEG